MYDATAAKPEVDEVEVAESDLLWTSIEWRQAQERSDTMNGTAWLKNTAWLRQLLVKHMEWIVEKVYLELNQVSMHSCACVSDRCINTIFIKN